jgi:glycosyltransferase involved in cell wall biosynthesis
MRSRLSRSDRSRPRLSVIVPVYNVERYLEECLDSIAAQETGEVECIIVNDGSTDRSAAIASKFADQHRFWHLLNTENKGLGAARNTGLGYSHGEYVAFADGDDIVPPYAYDLMVSTLDSTGSDFVVGSVHRNFPDGIKEPPWIARFHRRRRERIKIDDHPELMADVYVWNKVFRRSFWNRLGIDFPEGVRYEDQPVTTLAYLKADAFDVLVRPVYCWRIRDDSSSITQRRSELRDLQDRIITKRMTRNAVEQLASPHARRVWYTQVMPADMHLYLQAILGCNDYYWITLRSAVLELWRDAPSVCESAMSPPYRVLGWLVYHDKRAEAETVLRFLTDCAGDLQAEWRGDRSIARLPYLDDADVGIPTDCFVLRGKTAQRLAELRSGDSPNDVHTI